MSNKLLMSNITAGEAREIYPKNPTILLPIGSHEDQGPHAPMGDFLLAEKLALGIASRATSEGNATYVAPVLPFGGADYFGSMIGGIAISQSTLRAVLTDMLDCLLRHNLTNIFIINGHAGNVQAVHDVTQVVYHERGILIPSMYPWKIAYGLLPGILGADLAKKTSGHGADPLTSLVMHLSPEMIRNDMFPAPHPAPHFRGLQVGALGSVIFNGAEINVPLEIAEMAPIGVTRGADPSLCSAKAGEKLFEQLTAIGAALIARGLMSEQ